MTDIHTPNWVKHAIFYQIFPDRFARSPRAPQLPGVAFKPWGSPPEEQGFQGGDLYGVADKLGYLKELGITALYLNPIFASAANHRYHTFDYYQVDPLLGGNAALRTLLDEAHALGIKVVLDGVFNHASRGFWAFHHILECGGNSPYLDWFFVQDWPLNPYPRKRREHLNYTGWANLAGLPKFNTNNPGVRAYLLDVARYWVDFGIDGWRLDVPNEIDDDSFWQEFRRRVHQANPDAYIVGEIWGDGSRWLQGDQFDAIMNYVFLALAVQFFGKKTYHRSYEKARRYGLRVRNAVNFAQYLETLYRTYNWEITLAQLNLIDSHDTARFHWMVNGDQSALRLAALFQMVMPGAPCIYYGDEVGMTGQDDPGCRGAFPWQAEESWDHDLLAFYRQITALRHRYPALRAGSFETLYAAGDVYALLRRLDDHYAIAAFNTSQEELQVSIALPAELANVPWQTAWPASSDAAQQAENGLLKLALPPRSGLVLVNR